MRRSMRLATLSAITLSLLAGAPAIAQVTATIQDCLVNEVGFNCEEKTSIEVPVSYGLQSTFEVIQITTIQKDGEPFPLEETIEFDLVKTEPRFVYPLKYFHTVLYHPLESEPPYDDDLQYHGYEIEPYTEHFTIDFNLKKGQDTHEFTLTPQNPFYSVNEANGWKLKAELARYDSNDPRVPELDNYILYIPASPDTHPYVQDYAHNMLLVPREEVSRTGTDCSRVGSEPLLRCEGELKVECKDGECEYECKTEEGAPPFVACIDDQLFDKHNADLQKLIFNPDAETTYLLHGRRPFKYSMDFKQGMAKILEYRVPYIRHSTVRITLTAETLKDVSTESLGIIIDAKVKDFTSMTSQGEMEVRIQNWGDLKTDYVVTVTECNMNIDPAIPAQARILNPFEEATLYIPIRTQYNLDTSNECLVSLTSPTGRLYDEVLVEFDTFKNLGEPLAP